MIAVTVDKLCVKHPAFEKYVRERIDVFFATTTAANIAVFLISGITAGILCSAQTGIFLQYASIAAMTAAWIFTSLLAGFLRQWLFIMAPALYLTLPNVLYIPPDNGGAEQASQLGAFLSDISDKVLLAPVKIFAGENDLYIVSVIMFAVCAVIFLIGARMRAYAKRCNIYCKQRLEQLSDK